MTTENSDWATNCPEYKVTAVEVALVEVRTAWQKEFDRQAEEQARLAPDALAD